VLQGQPLAPGGCGDTGAPAGSIPPAEHRGRLLRQCGSPPSCRVGSHEATEGCTSTGDGETEAGRAVEVAPWVCGHAGARASVWGVWLPRCLGKASYSLRLSQGSQQHRLQPERPFWGEDSRNPGGVTSGEQLAGTPSLLPVLGKRPPCWGTLTAALGRGHGPRLAINHPPHVCPLALTSPGPRLMDYPFNPTSP